MALGRMTKSMSGMGGVKQQMPVAPPAPAPKKRSVLSRARAPAVVPQGSPQQPPAFNSAQLQQLQQEKVLREQQNQSYLSNPAKMAQLAQAPNNLQNLAAQQAAFTKQQADAQKQSMAMANAPKMPAMRKGGAVKKKPGYAKGGMVMANCGASMKPQQKAKK